jgi:hypothetical protein
VVTGRQPPGVPTRFALDLRRRLGGASDHGPSQAARHPHCLRPAQLRLPGGRAVPASRYGACTLAVCPGTLSPHAGIALHADSGSLRLGKNPLPGNPGPLGHLGEWWVNRQSNLSRDGQPRGSGHLTPAGWAGKDPSPPCTRIFVRRANRRQRRKQRTASVLSVSSCSTCTRTTAPAGRPRGRLSAGQ